MTKEAPWGNLDDIEGYDRWRRGFVESAREWADGDISMFLNNRLTFQRGRRGFEIEDYSPWENPECALIDTFLVLRTEEYDAWTEEELAKISKISAALISVTFPQLLKGNEGFWGNTEYPVLDHYFEDSSKVVLQDDEARALGTVLKRIDREVDPDQRIFQKPDIEK